MAKLIRNIKSYILRYRFKNYGFSEINGDFGRYYTKRGSNVVLFIPER